MSNRLMKFGLLSLILAHYGNSEAMTAAGLIAKDSTGIVEKVEISRKVFFGGCPGEETQPLEAWFTSNTTPSQPGYRVTITNQTPSFEVEHRPFASRRYETSDLSEHTFLFPGTRHRTRTLTVANGLNEFGYVIDDGRDVVEAGAFSLEISIVTENIARDPEVVWEWDCFPQTGPIPQCTYRAKLRCPI